MFADVSSGRSSFVTSRLTNCVMPASAAASIFSTEALPPSTATGSKPVARTVMTLTGS
jgi:hypothetical protein